MSFETNPAEEYPDPHGECRHEIHRLQAVNAELLAACQRLRRNEAAIDKCMEVARVRYDQLHAAYRDGKTNEEIADLVRQCVTNWNDVEEVPK